MHSVLVVDDEPFVRLSIASLRVWSDEGFDFRFEASNGSEALRLLADRPEIDIVLLDLSMPVMNGIEFLKRLRAEGRGPALPPAVIVLSAYNDFHLVREAFTLGAGDYLLKAEIEVESLADALAKAAAGLEDSRERSVSILERGQLDLLKAQLLKDLLAEGAPAGLAESFSGLGVRLAPPIVPCCFWIEDFCVVAERWGADELGRFADMAVRSLRQVLAKRGGGEVVALNSDHLVALFSLSSGESGAVEAGARAFCEDAAEYLGRYLSVRVSYSLGAVCLSFDDALASYKAARASRRVESRIVVVAKRLIRERYADPDFSLEEASAKVGVSKNHLSFEFSREAGETFTGYLSRVRIEEAKRLLASTDLMVYEVCERVGYPSVEHFSRVFKKIVGVSPVRFKQGAES